MNTNDRGPNNCEFLKHVLERLQQHGFASLIFGGWAEGCFSWCLRARIAMSICCFQPIRLSRSIGEAICA
jgi:hypothetical protein